MTVHVDSKIDAWVNTFHPDFYASITDKENWAYVDKAGDTDALNAWKAYFEELMTRMNAWKASNYAIRTAGNTNNLISVIFTYKMYGVRYETDMSQVATVNAATIFDIGGFIPATLGRPVDYYQDMDMLFTSELIQADIDGLEEATWQAYETNSFNTAITNARAPALEFGNRSMFADPPEPVGTITKQQMATFIFIDLKYKHIRDNVPGVLGIQVPEFLE